MDNLLLSAEQLAERLGVSKSTIYKMLTRRLIPAIPVGPSLSGRRFSFAAVCAALENAPTAKRPYHPPKHRRIEKVEVCAGK